jgi:hypothetical protein
VIAVKCPCGARLGAPDGSLGKRGKCPQCKASFPIVPWVMCSDCLADVQLDAEGRFACTCQRRGRIRCAFVGPPGSTWTNTTGRYLYQFRPSFHEGGATCFRISGHIGPSWGIPHMRGCNCIQAVIRPGETSSPFPDGDSDLARTTAAQRDLILGRNNRLLLDAGLVGWPDLIGRFTVIELDHVINTKGLALEAILAAGVSEKEARASWDRVSLRRVDDNKRRESIAKLKAAGLTLEVERG